MINPDLLREMRYYIIEREKVRTLKEAGAPKPWTEDLILRSYRFCNVQREDDVVTRWLAANWRSAENWSHHNFVAATIFARTINWPATLAYVGFPYLWDNALMCAKLDEYQAKHSKTYTAAYFITGKTGVRKNLWVTGNANSYFFNPPKIDPFSLQVSWERIIDEGYPCVGPFIAGQVIADLKQTSHLAEAKDWWDWAALGPGSTRGLNRLHERAIKQSIKQGQGLEEMLEVRERLALPFKLCLQDVQSCLCEYDKYSRVLYGGGKPKSGYPGTSGA